MNDVITYFQNNNTLFNDTDILFFDQKSNNYQEIAKYFPTSTIPQKMDQIFKSTRWLFLIDLDQIYSPLGLYYTEQYGNIVIYMDKDYKLKLASPSIQDFPYFAFLLSSVIMDENEIDSNIQELLKYETWCKENNISLDHFNLYHNKDGQIFSYYSDIHVSMDFEKQIYHDIFPSIEEQQIR